MKKFIFIFILLASLQLGVNPIYAQHQDPPDPPGGHGSGGNEPPGGGAPIGGGLFILLGLSAAYGGKKWYEQRKEPLEE